jgi:hypothetical protein
MKLVSLTRDLHIMSRHGLGSNPECVDLVLELSLAIVVHEAMCLCFRVRVIGLYKP